MLTHDNILVSQIGQISRGGWYRHKWSIIGLPLWRVWFSSILLWDRVYKSEFGSRRGYHFPYKLISWLKILGAHHHFCIEMLTHDNILVSQIGQISRGGWYRHKWSIIGLPLWRVWFSSILLWDRVYKSEFGSRRGYHFPYKLISWLKILV